MSASARCTRRHGVPVASASTGTPIAYSTAATASATSTSATDGRTGRSAWRSPSWHRDQHAAVADSASLAGVVDAP